MSKKNYALVLVFACLTIISGLVFLFDSLGIAFTGAVNKWYLVLMIYLASGLIAVAIIKNAPLYYTVSSVFVGVFLSMSLNKPFAEFWPMIPISISIGMMISHLMSHGRLKYFKPALILLVLSVILLIGSLTDKWRYIIPIELIIFGAIVVIYVLYKLQKSSKTTNHNNVDYYVRPSSEKNKDNDKQ